MHIRTLTRIFFNLCRTVGIRRAVRSMARHVAIRLRADRLVSVPTPAEYVHHTTAGGERCTATRSFRAGGTGPLITEYKRERPPVR